MATVPGASVDAQIDIVGMGPADAHRAAIGILAVVCPCQSEGQALAWNYQVGGRYVIVSGCGVDRFGDRGGGVGRCPRLSESAAHIRDAAEGNRHAAAARQIRRQVEADRDARASGGIAFGKGDTDTSAGEACLRLHTSVKRYGKQRQRKMCANRHHNLLNELAQ